MEWKILSATSIAKFWTSISCVAPHRQAEVDLWIGI